MIPLVLFIDDDRSSQILMAAYLKDVSFCHSFTSQTDGREALDYLTGLPSDPSLAVWPDIIFLDISMPNLDGWGFLEGFAALSQNLENTPPIIMISATNTAKDISRAKDHPLVTDLIIKPVSSAVLKKLSSLPELCDYFDRNKNTSANPLVVSEK